MAASFWQMVDALYFSVHAAVSKLYLAVVSCNSNLVLLVTTMKLTFPREVGGVGSVTVDVSCLHHVAAGIQLGVSSSL